MTINRMTICYCTINEVFDRTRSSLFTFSYKKVF